MFTIYPLILTIRKSRKLILYYTTLENRKIASDAYKEYEPEFAIPYNLPFDFAMGMITASMMLESDLL